MFFLKKIINVSAVSYILCCGVLAYQDVSLRNGGVSLVVIDSPLDAGVAHETAGKAKRGKREE